VLDEIRAYPSNYPRLLRAAPRSSRISRAQQRSIAVAQNRLRGAQSRAATSTLAGYGLRGVVGLE
jgi:hypothetical protein